MESHFKKFTTLSSLSQEFSTWSNVFLLFFFPHPGEIWQCPESWQDREGCAPGILWIEAQDAAKIPTMHRTTSTKK